MSKKIGLLSVGLLGALAFMPQKALAFACANCVNEISYQALQGTANVELAAINASSATTASQTTLTHTYLTTGVTGGPGGVVALLSNINAKLGKTNMAENQSVENQDMANRQLVYDQKMMEIRTSKIATQSSLQDACVQATQGHGGSGGGRTTARAASKYGGKTGERYDDTRPAIQALIDTVDKKGELGVCSANDVANKMPGCAGGAGDRPNGDREATSLFNGGDVNNFSGTLDEKGTKIGLAYVSKILPNPPDKLTNDEAKKSQAGIVYMMNYDKFVARLSSYKIALNSILAFRTEMDKDAGANEFLKTWGSSQGEYEEIFGGGSFKATPSENDLIRFHVMRDYQGPTELAKQANMDDNALLKKLVQEQALNNRLQYEVLKRLEEQNIILSTMGAQTMEPLNSGVLDSQYAKANSAKDQ